MQRKRIKILLVAPSAPLIGGQAVQAQRILGKLKEEPNIQIDFQPINPPFFSSLQKIKYVRTIVTEIKYLFDLFVKIPKYDIIHIFSAGDSGFAISTIPAIFVAKIFKKKTILNYRHGGAEEHLKNWRKTALPTIKKVDRIITPSKFLVDVFAKFDLEAKSIFNFVDEEKYKFRFREKIRPIFLSNRNFEQLYNVSCTIKAFGLIQQKFPQAELFIIGDGEEKEKLKRLVEDSKLENVVFAGQIPSDKMPEMYDKADIYLNSPNIDNMPNSIIEAFACGIPVVSTNAGGIPYIVENGRTGLLVNVGDYEELANEAIRLLENSELSTNLISEAHQEVRKYFWQNVRAEWLTIYKELKEN